MLKSQENRLKIAMEKIEQQNVDQLKNHARNFEYEVKKLEESINLKVAELKSEMNKGLEKLEKNYSTLHGKVNVIDDAIAKLVEYNTLYSTKLDAKTTQDSKVFEKLEEFLSSLKKSLSKVDLSR
ncbi:unnamed protein product [Lactuca saligna]|uniref:Uncharacterized protein n=1 Tax=Lactuca saligna TaxID=75948 RepID=A0AA35ZA86_LACSI|nr:unnamed protein product [Lactuca saligna]